MYLLLIGALSMGMLVLTVNSAKSFEMSAYEGTASDHAVAQAESYRMFAYAAGERMKELPAPVSGAQVYKWQDLKAAGVIPDSMRNAQFPPNWKVVRTSTDWVICAEMDERAYARVAARVSKTGVKEVGQEKVLGENDDAKATDYASLCQSYN